MKDWRIMAFLADLDIGLSPRQVWASELTHFNNESCFFYVELNLVHSIALGACLVNDSFQHNACL